VLARACAEACLGVLQGLHQRARMSAEHPLRQARPCCLCWFMPRQPWHNTPMAAVLPQIFMGQLRQADTWCADGRGSGSTPSAWSCGQPTGCRVAAQQDLNVSVTPRPSHLLAPHNAPPCMHVQHVLLLLLALCKSMLRVNKLHTG
jgi:hypothetical protein